METTGPFIYKTTPVGDGSLFGWIKYDEEGNVVERSVQNYPSEADAEKAIRTISTVNDTIEVEQIKNINPGDNGNVNLVRKNVPVNERTHGMTEVDESIEDKKNPSAATRTSEQGVDRTRTTRNARRAVAGKTDKPKSGKKAKGFKKTR